MSDLVEVGHVDASGGNDVERMIFLAGGLAADLYFGRNQRESEICAGRDLDKIRAILAKTPTSVITVATMREAARSILSTNRSGPALTDLACWLMTRTGTIGERDLRDLITESLRPRSGQRFTFQPDPVAIHEAGHALVGHHLGMSVWSAWLHEQHTLAARYARAASVSSTERKK